MRYHDLPLHADPSGRFVPWIVALMVYLATISLIVASTISGVVQRWDMGLAGRLTVELPAPNLAQPGDASVQLQAQVKRLLLNTPGVAMVRQLSPQEVLKIIEPWVGGKEITVDIDVLPVLLDVELADRKFIHMAKLKESLTQLDAGITVEDHLKWQEGILDLAHSARVIGFSIVSMIMLAAICIIAFTAQTSLIIHRQVIEILYLVGATDEYIARQFQNHALRVGLKGGLIGLVLFGVTFILLGFFARHLDTRLLADVMSPIMLWTIAIIIPLVVTALMMLSARFTVQIALRYVV
jgi:cell division transport system permease protein